MSNVSRSPWWQPLFMILKQRGIRSVARTIWLLFKHDGVMGIKRRLVRTHRNDYIQWIREYDVLNADQRKAILNRIQAMPNKPVISIVLPVYNPPPHLLNHAIQSVREQLYPYWQLCIADDASKTEAVIALLQRHASEDSRIKLVLRADNGHISKASNSALALATGDFVALMDHDDLLPEHALFWVADAINHYPEAGLIYSDEDKIDTHGVRQDPYFKPDWNPELFLSHNLISHLGVYRRSLLQEINGFRVGFEGAQDYDLALRCIEKLKPEQIIHIPRVLYHWRIHSESTAASLATKPYAVINGEKALNEHLQRRGILGTAQSCQVGYKINYALPEVPPLVSLIIPTRNGLHLLKQCIDSILTKTTYPNYEILIIDNGSDDPEILSYFKVLEKNHHRSANSHDLLKMMPSIRIIRDDQPFNYSALNNAAVRQANGTVIGLINNDIEVISPDWLNEMVALALQPGIGAVGAKLWYANDTLQHAGVVVGLGGVAGHSHKGFSKQHRGYCSRTSLVSNYSAVTAACLVIQKAIYDTVGGLNEVNLKVAFNDVDFCLKVKEAGFRNAWTPYAELYHHESATRGIEDTPEKKARFMQEVHFMQSQWGKKLQVDSAYSPNLSIHHEDFSLAWPPRVTEINAE